MKSFYIYVSKYKKEAVNSLTASSEMFYEIKSP
jgi:hypothetical protein